MLRNVYTSILLVFNVIVQKVRTRIAIVYGYQQWFFVLYFRLRESFHPIFIQKRVGFRFDEVSVLAG